MKVVYTPQALRNLDNAYTYIFADNPDAAARTLAIVRAALKTLESHPEIGRPGRVEGTRELRLAGSPFILVYRQKEQRLEIIDILHSSRSYPGA